MRPVQFKERLCARCGRFTGSAARSSSISRRGSSAIIWISSRPLPDFMSRHSHALLRLEISVPLSRKHLKQASRLGSVDVYCGSFRRAGSVLGYGAIPTAKIKEGLRRLPGCFRQHEVERNGCASHTWRSPAFREGCRNATTRAAFPAVGPPTPAERILPSSRDCCFFWLPDRECSCRPETG